MLPTPTSRRLFTLLCLALLLPQPARSEPAWANLAAMRRKFFANCIWSVDRARMHGQEVEGSLSGLGGSEDSMMVYELEHPFELFESWVGYLDGTPASRAAVFEVWADGAMLRRVGPLQSGEPPERIRVPIKGARVLTLRIFPERYDHTHGAAWGSPRLWTGLQGHMPGEVLLDLDGRRQPVDPLVGRGGTRLPVPIPLKEGEHTYQVRIRFQAGSGIAEVEVEEGPPRSTPGEAPQP